MKNKIMVIGDIILDETIQTNVIGLSLETPTLKVSHQESKINFGGAANVAKHISKLRKNCLFVSVRGNDQYKKFIDNLKNEYLDIDLIDDEKRINNVKTRIWVKKGNQNYKYLQINSEIKIDISNTTKAKFLNKIKSNLQSGDISKVVIVDYRTGLFNKKTIEDIIRECNRLKIKTICSSQLSSNSESRYSFFKDSNFIVLNEEEALSFVDNLDHKDIIENFKTNVCVTLGSEGSVIFTNDSIISSKGYKKVNVIDTCGAGDAFLACFVTGKNLQTIENLKRSNLWAGLSTEKLGTEKPEYNEFLNRLENDFE